MARYFKYKSPAELVADAERLGQAMSVSDDFAPLFELVEIGPRRAGNRLAIHPMEGCDGHLDGLPGELTFRRYRRFGAGGAKIIWGEATAVADEGRMNPRQLWLNDKTASSVEDMLSVCRAAHREAVGSDGDLLVGLQLTHSGRYSFRKPLLATHDPVLDPLTLDRSSGKLIDASYPILSDDDLKRIEDQFVAAARLAFKVGVDFVDIKQCHRYLLSELLASKNRAGLYGGSLENRTRLVRNIATGIRNEIPALLLATRMNAYDGIPYCRRENDAVGAPCRHELPLVTAFGTNPQNHLVEDLTEPLEVAGMLRSLGFCLFSISAGNPYANPHIVRPAEFPPIDGYHAPEHPLVGVLRHFRIARLFQAALGNTPVVGSGYSWLQDYCMHAAAANVAQRHVAVVGLGRQTLAHPDFAAELLKTGHLNRRIVCRTFSYCTNLMRTKQHPMGQFPTGCPPFDKDVYGPLWKDAEPLLTRKTTPTSDAS